MARKRNYPSRQYTDTQASCSKCNSMKDFSEFCKDQFAPLQLSYWCKVCASANTRKNHKRRIESGDLSYKRGKRNGWLKRAHGITLQQYEDKLVAQGSKCAICDIALLSAGPLTHLDHCHQTGKLRDFLCTNCNRGLGHFKDSVKNLEKAVQYLNTHSGNVDAEKEVMPL